MPLWPDAGNIHVQAIKARDGREIQSFAVRIAPGQVGRIFERTNRPQMLSLGRENPDAAGARAVDIPIFIDFHAVGHAIFLCGRHVDEEFGIGDRVIGLHFIAPIFFGEGIVHVEIFFVGRKRDAVGRAQILDDQLQLSIFIKIDAVVRKLFLRIVIAFAEAERRVRDIERAVGLVDQIVRAVEALAVILVRKDRTLAVFFQTNDAVVTMLNERDAALLIERDAIRADRE